jgi:putative glutamine amidotransferase
MKKIGITTSQMIMVDPSLCGNKKTSVNTSYVQSIQETGALPVLIPYVLSRWEMEQYVSMCDGFLLTGGMDIAPVLYGAMPQRCGAFDYEVNVCLLEFVKLALESHKSILGILPRDADGQYCLGRYFDPRHSGPIRDRPFL